MKEKILETKLLCKSFANEGIQNHVINDLNLEIYKGDFTVIMGASGSGKSTLLYNISGMDQPTSGQVLYQEQDILSFKEKQMAALRTLHFGFIFQQVNLVGNLSLEENILIPGYMNKKLSKQEAKERTQILMKRMHLEKVAKHLPSQVSGGEAQRAAIARAIINQPDILFADEPTGALNRKNTIDVLDLLTELNSEGQSILMVTHDMKAALRASRILYLVDGRICGELNLPAYDAENRKARETQLTAWLNSMQW